jgi:hypothetical protein
MHGRVRIAAIGTALVGASVLVQGSAIAGSEDSGGGGDDGSSTLEFDVQFSPFNYTDLGEPGPSAADQIVFDDTLLQDGRQVGHEVGSCVVVAVSGLSSCTVVLTLDGRGTLAYALENSPPPRKVLAVTGGSGEFRTARGDGVLVENGDGTGVLTLSISDR